MRRIAVAALVVAALAVLALPPGARAAPPDVRRVRLEDGAGSPHAARDAAGALHIVYGRERAAWYVRLEPKGREVGEPVRVSPPGVEVEVGMERGPRIAVGREGRLHVAWMGPRGRGVLYARSADGGRTFEAARDVLDRAVEVDGPAIAADATGRVYVVWLDARLPPSPTSPFSGAPFLARSTDDGATFGANEPIAHDYAGRACGCCSLSAETSPEGRLAVSFRGAHLSIRDPFVLLADKEARRFAAARVSADQWKLDACPMSGIAFAFVPEGRGALVAAWMSAGRVYCAAAGKDGRFGARVAATEKPGAREQKLPGVAAAKGGSALVVWTEGPTVRWLLLEKGKPGARGEMAGLPERSRPVPAVAGDGDLVIVY